MPPEVYSKFASELFGTPTTVDYLKAMNRFIAKLANSDHRPRTQPPGDKEFPRSRPPGARAEPDGAGSADKRGHFARAQDGARRQGDGSGAQLS
jgi:hypothetical protein